MVTKAIEILDTDILSEVSLQDGFPLVLGAEFLTGHNLDPNKAVTIRELKTSEFPPSLPAPVMTGIEYKVLFPETEFGVDNTMYVPQYVEEPLQALLEVLNAYWGGTLVEVGDRFNMVVNQKLRPVEVTEVKRERFRIKYDLDITSYTAWRPGIRVCTKLFYMPNQVVSGLRRGVK